MRLFVKESETFSCHTEELTEEIETSFRKKMIDSWINHACFIREKKTKQKGMDFVIVPRIEVFVWNEKLVVIKFDENDKPHEIWECDTLEDFKEALEEI